MLTLQALAQLWEKHASQTAPPPKPFALRGRTFRFDESRHLMGVINLSPDSWYRESVCLSVESAVRRGRVLAEQGACLVDVGAESTLGHAARVGATAQQDRLLPVVRELARSGILVSVETYRLAVARACLEAGAAVLNLTGVPGDSRIFKLVAEHDAALILCYVEGKHVRSVGDFDLAGDPIDRMREFFARQIERAERCGVRRIFIDPGMGFYYRNLRDSAQRVRHQLAVFLNTFRLRPLGRPICHALPHAFEYFGEEVRGAEPFFATWAALGGADLFRTHEIPGTRAVLETMSVYRPAP